jgi:hypothetical protein
VKHTLVVLTMLHGVAAMPVVAQDHVISADALSAHTRFLADDLLLGRGTGSPGARQAALYIESQCRRIGLQPVNGGYRLPVQLEEARILPSTSLRLTRGQGAIDYLYPVDFVPNVATAAAMAAF